MYLLGPHKLAGSACLVIAALLGVEPAALVRARSGLHALSAAETLDPVRITGTEVEPVAHKTRGHFEEVTTHGQFRRKGRLGDFLFYLDHFSFRHRVKKWLGGAPVQDQSSESVPCPVWQPDLVHDLVEEYKFSSWARHQAGLTLAVCRH